MSSKIRILFVGEAVTLAHVCRLYTLAKSLRSDQYDLHFASSGCFNTLFDFSSFQVHQLPSLTPSAFTNALRSGKWPYTKAVLSQYVKDDLKLLEVVDPDLVVGDMRLSLAISCHVFGVKLFTLTNAYWSPFASNRVWHAPESPIARFLGAGMADKLFRSMLPRITSSMLKEVNAVSSEFGSPQFPSFLESFTGGDATLYADLPTLVPSSGQPTHHHYLGPILWSPNCSLPNWWDQFRSRGSFIYVTLGSSGDPNKLLSIVETISILGLRALVATAGKKLPFELPRGIVATAFVPGETIVKEAALTICNGGSPTTYQSLAAGVPVLGVASNLDQHLMMHYVEASGAGLAQRAERLRAKHLERALRKLLDSPTYTESARRLQSEISTWEATKKFRRLLERSGPNISPPIAIGS